MPLTPEIRRLVTAQMEGLPELDHDPAQGLPLQVTSFGADEVLEALDAMMSTRVTMGARVRAFEAAWASVCGVRHAVMVNSGSSANLLAWVAVVTTGRLRPGDEVLVPAAGWSTSLFPVLQAGLEAALVDVEPTTLCMDPDRARTALERGTRGTFAVHLLGCPADTDALSTVGDGLLLLEDACGAHGASLRGRPVGSLGLAGTFSFFFSHHVTTMEGGVLVTDDDELADVARSLRAHGWIREMCRADEIAAAWPDTDRRFLFLHPGYNLRPTELAAGFGLHQVGRLPAFVARRRANHRDWCDRIHAAGLPVQVLPEPPDRVHSAFAFPLILDPAAPYPRSALLAALERRGIATRPISGGNLARQPVLRSLRGVRVAGPLPVADAIHDRGFFVGQSHAFGPAHGDILVQALLESDHALRR